MESASLKPTHCFMFLDDTIVMWPYGTQQLQKFTELEFFEQNYAVHTVNRK